MMNIKTIMLSAALVTSVSYSQSSVESVYLLPGAPENNGIRLKDYGKVYLEHETENDAVSKVEYLTQRNNVTSESRPTKWEQLSAKHYLATNDYKALWLKREDMAHWRFQVLKGALAKQIFDRLKEKAEQQGQIVLTIRKEAPENPYVDCLEEPTTTTPTWIRQSVNAWEGY